jgi:hypothetical protein
MPKPIVTQERHDEIFEEYADLADFFMTAMETSSTRVLQTLRDRLPIEDRPAISVEYPFGNPFVLIPRLNEMLGYDGSNINNDELNLFEYGSDIASLRSIVQDFAKMSDDILTRIDDYKNRLDRCRDHRKTRLPQDRTDQYGTLLTEEAYEKAIKKYIKDTRKRLNPYEYTEYTVSREVMLRAQTTENEWKDLRFTYFLNQRQIHTEINKCVRKKYVKLVVVAYSRFKGDPVDLNSTHRDDGMVLWTNPDEDVHALLEFSEL